MIDAASLQYVAPVFRVADFARSLEFYQARLGFSVEFNYQGSYAGLARDGCHVHLKSGAPFARAAAAVDATEHIDACFGVRDADALAGELAARGARMVVPLRAQPYGKEFYVSDPDGYVLGFVEPA